MIEGLVILRDIILAVVLSWIGVDYPLEQENSARQQFIVRTAGNAEAPLMLITNNQPVKQSFGCKNSVLQS